MHACVLARNSHVPLFVTPWTIARQAPLSMKFSRQEYWSGLPFPSPGDLPNPGIKLVTLMSPALAGRFFTIGIFSNELALLIRSLKYWNFSFSPFNNKSFSNSQFNNQGQFPLGLTGLISLQSSGLSRIFSNITSSALNFLYGQTPTSIYDYWKNHNYEYLDICWQSDVSAF